VSTIVTTICTDRTTTMDDIRDSFSRLKKDLKHRLKGRKNKPDMAGTNTAGESVDSSGSLLRPDSRVVAGGHDGEGSGTNAAEQQARSRDRYPQPAEPGPTGGSDDDRQRREADVDGKEVNQGHSRPDLDVETGAVGGEEPDQTYPSPPIPSIPPTRKPDGMRTCSIQLLHLIVPSDNPNTSTIPDHVPEDTHPNKNAKPSAAPIEKKSNWKSTVSATAKLLLRGVRDSADAFGPLKSVAGCLCFILENSEVLPSFHIRFSQHL